VSELPDQCAKPGCENERGVGLTICNGHSEDPYRVYPVASDQVNHPAHYGGKDNLYEVIKVIEAWHLGFHLGNVVKYVSRAGKKDPEQMIEDLKKARWYLDRAISYLH